MDATQTQTGEPGISMMMEACETHPNDMNIENMNTDEMGTSEDDSSLLGPELRSTVREAADEQRAIATAMTARAYQREMFEESLKQNIIVAVNRHETTPLTIPGQCPLTKLATDGYGKRQDSGGCPAHSRRAWPKRKGRAPSRRRSPLILAHTNNHFSGSGS